MQFRIGLGIENCAPRKRNAHFRILSDSFGFESERLFSGLLRRNANFRIRALTFGFRSDWNPNGFSKDSSSKTPISDSYTVWDL